MSEERHRRWSVREKAAPMKETYVPGMSVPLELSIKPVHTPVNRTQANGMAESKGRGHIDVSLAGPNTRNFVI